MGESILSCKCLLIFFSFGEVVSLLFCDNGVEKDFFEELLLLLPALLLSYLSGVFVGVFSFDADDDGMLQLTDFPFILFPSALIEYATRPATDESVVAISLLLGLWPQFSSPFLDALDLLLPYLLKLVKALFNRSVFSIPLKSGIARVQGMQDLFPHP